MPEIGADVELHPLSRRGTFATLALFIALAVLHTWPLATGLNSLSRHDNADAVLNEWMIAWVAHQLLNDPTRLFDANIFHPEPNTLAFSDHLLLQSLLGAPLLWAGVSTLIVHNVLIIAGFALTGWAMALVVRRWTGDWWAAVLAGMLLAFNAHTLTRLAHLQAVHIEFLPLAMLALDRVLVRPRVVTALQLALAFVFLSLASNYFLVFITFGLVGAALSRPAEWLTPARARTFALLSLAAAAAVLLLSPILVHYLWAQRDQGLTRDLSEVARFAASWRDYLAASSRLHHGWWSAGFARGDGAYLFPGMTALLLTLAALLTGAAWRPAARIWVALGLVGLVLSFGTSVPGYELLYVAVPLLQGIRASVRFGSLVLAAVAALAAFGLAALRLRLADRRRWQLALSAGALVLVTVEAARVPLGFTPAYRSPAVYQFLRNEPDAVLVELPLYSPSRVMRNASYMLHSTRHWRPILNGYSGFTPRSYVTHWENLTAFPDAGPLEYLRRLGVTHVAVHRREFGTLRGEDRLRRIDESRVLTRLVHGGDVAIYRLEQADR